MATLKQKRVVAKIVENHGNVGKSMVEVGYTEATAKNPKNLTESKGYKEAVAPIVKQMEDEREEVMKRLKLTRDKAKYRDLMDGLDKLTKHIQLLTGGKTSNDEIKISWK